MNCSTPESSVVLVVDHMERLSGNLLTNRLDPEANDLTEASLEKLLIQMMDSAKYTSHPDGVALVSARHPGWRGYESWSLRRRRLPNTRLARVAREEVEDGLVPPRSIRGWSFVADFAYVDRRRVKRLMRRHYKECRNAPVRNHSIRNKRARA